MPDYDAIVIGAGHNGLTAAVVMARGGMRVLCLEKNHFIGGMATTTELARGYRFELAGSIQFPVPSEIYDDLGFAQCPIFEPDVQSAAIGPSGEPPLLLHSDPDKLFEHLNDRMGLDAVLGMAEIAAWADAPARAIGRFDVRTPPKSLDEMFACATNEKERQAIRTAMFGSVMDVIDHHLPDRQRHAQVRSMLAFLSVNSTYRGPYSEGSALCLAFALASPTGATMSKVKGGIGTLSDHLAVGGGGAGGGRRTGANSGATSRWPGSPPKRAGSSASVSPTARRSAHRWWCRTSTRRPRSPSSSNATNCRTTSSAGSTPSTIAPSTSRCTSP
jgi:phytoene dehydrogenase-like protein